MDQALKREWIIALRSGKYKQGRLLLRRDTTDGPVHCCLGVVAQIVVGPDALLLNYEASGLSNDVMWQLIKMNDEENRSFDHIAGWIEASL